MAECDLPKVEIGVRFPVPAPMKTIIVASKNPVKIEAARSAFTQMFPEETFGFEGVSVESGVRDQPMTDEETLTGARTRVENARIAHPDADFYISFEGGCEEDTEELRAFAWTVVESREGKFGKGRSGTFYLPHEVAVLVLGGKELGEADDIVFGRTNSKEQNGAVGLLTHDIFDRTSNYAYAAILALIPLKNPHLYQ